MRVLTARYSGFCPGVVQAERKIFRAREKLTGEQISVLGYLIHNQTYIDHLAEKSIRTIQTPGEAPPGSVLVLRTHGLDRKVEEELQGRYEMLDLTCPKVKKVQLIIRDYSRRGFFVLITGKRNHPEVQGLLSYAEKAEVLETRGDVERFASALMGFPIGKILILSQTTGEAELFEFAGLRVKEAAEGLGIPVEIHDSICSITSLREREAAKLQKEVDVTFVIGDRMSSNATKLFNILAAGAKDTYFVSSREELEGLGLDFSSWKTAQVVSSSSTPSFVEREVVSFLEAL